MCPDSSQGRSLERPGWHQDQSREFSGQAKAIVSQCHFASPAPSPLATTLTSPTELSSHKNFEAKGQVGFKVWELTENFQSNGEYSGSSIPGISVIASVNSIHLEIDRLRPSIVPTPPSLLSPAWATRILLLLEHSATKIPVSPCDQLPRLLLPLLS